MSFQIRLTRLKNDREIKKEEISRCNEESEISESGMSGWSQADIEPENGIEEEFCAVVHSIKSEEERYADIKPATLPDFYQLQRVEMRSEYSKSTLQSDDDVCLSLRCRLCAIPSNDMVEIFSSFQMTKDILEKIEYSLPIVVKETDTLPKQICRLCLEELERCYRFHEAVAEADKRLVVYERLVSMKSEETERNNNSFLLNDAQQGFTEFQNVDGLSETNFDIEMDDDKSTIKQKDALNLRSHPFVSYIYKTRSTNDSDTKNSRNSSSNTKDRNTNGGIVSENHPASTCDPKVNMENPDDSTLAQFRERPYECNICEKTFKQKHGMTQHSRIHRNGESRPHKCGICAKTYIQRSHLTQHSQMHTDERLWPHKCDVCAKMFTRKSDLIRHSLIHKDERLWPRAKTFKQKENILQP